MPKLYVKLHGCYGLPKGNYSFTGNVQPMNIKTSDVCSQDSRRNLTIGKAHLELTMGNRYDNILVLCMKDNATKQDCCRVALPLHWFPADQTARTWFPMKSYISGVQGSYMADIEVHMKKNFSYVPFGAPKSPILVLPAWNQPGKPALPPKPHGPVPPGCTRIPVPVPPKPAVHGTDPAKTKALPQATVSYGPMTTAPLPPGMAPPVPMQPQPAPYAPPPYPAYPSMPMHAPPPSYPAYPDFDTGSSPLPSPYQNLPDPK